MKLASPWSITFALVLTLSVATPRGMAQPGEAKQKAETTQGETSPLATGEQLLGDIRATQEEVRELKSQFERAQGEDRAAAWEQITRKRLEGWDTVEKLYGIVLKLGGSGTDAGELEKQTVAIARNVSQNLQGDITDLRKQLVKLRATRESTSPEELPALDDLLTKGNEQLSEYLQILFENDQYLEKFGVDVRQDFAFLDETLQGRAEGTAGRIQLLLTEISNLEGRLQTVEEAEAGALNAQLNQLRKRLENMTRSLASVVDLMTERSLDAAEYKKLLITSTGDITADILDREVAVSLIGDWAASARNALIENSPRFLFKVFLFLFILFVFKLLANFVQRIVRRALSHAKVPFSRLLQDFFLSIASRVVMLLGLMIALSQMGLELGPLLAGLGIAGFVVGFALQDTLSNFASGMMILVYRPFDVGDVIQAGGVSGKVSQMNLVSTTILTFDNQKLIVPNTKIWGDVIINVTAETTRRVDLVFGIGYGDDIDHAERILKEIVDAHARILKTPEPVIRLHTLGESSVDFVVRPWAKTSDYWDVYWDLTREVKRRFDAEGISIPFPQRDVHVFQEQPPAPGKSEE